MATINSIRIKNFKGAADVSLTLVGKITTPVITLIGLNESGKTTILEGLSYFVSKDNAVSKIFEGVHSPSAISGLIPIHQKAAFTGDVSIIANVSLAESDVDLAIKAAAEGEFAVNIQRDSIPRNFNVAQVYRFVDSINTASSRNWTFTFSGRFKGKRPKSFIGNEPRETPERKAWSNVVDAISEFLPRISYFPTFLVDMPSRIYLEEHDDERPVKHDLPYASFYISDGESKYSVSERSLGFRWFFSFLLFTAFKKASSRPTLFLFDEPAANLHAKAQAELLKSFSKITADGNQIIYSTHSHYMINPQWLQGSYIVENKALDYDSDEPFGLTTKPTNIVATPYRQFVSAYPERSSYFQPVIDQLEYVVPAIVGSPPFIIVEGITDFYAFKLVQDESDKHSIMPGCGSGSSGALISWLLGRGEKFILVLDDDRAGKSAAKKYADEWFLNENSVATLGQLSPEFVGKKLESLISTETKTGIKAALSKTNMPRKKEIGLYFAELFALGNSPSMCLSEITKHNLREILKKAGERLDAQL